MVNNEVSQNESQEISLVDLIKPLYHKRLWIILAAVIGLMFAAVHYFIIQKSNFEVRTTIQTPALSFNQYALAKILVSKQLEDFKIPLLQSQGINIKEYFIPIEEIIGQQKVMGTSNKAITKIMDLRYDSPPGVPDSYRYPQLATDTRGLGSERSEFSLIFATRHNDRVLMNNLAYELSSRYWLPQLYLASFNVRIQTKIDEIKSKQLFDESDERQLLVRIKAINERIALLQEFLRTYPSLLRENYTLNNYIIPVEVQLMNARSELLDLQQRVRGIQENSAINDLYTAMRIALQKTTLLNSTQGLSILDITEIESILHDLIREHFTIKSLTVTEITDTQRLQEIVAAESRGLQDFSKTLASGFIQRINNTKVDILVEPKSFNIPLVLIFACIFLSIFAIYVVSFFQVYHDKLISKQ